MKSVAGIANRKIVMPDNTYLLDTSAIFALIEDKGVADRVEQVLAEAEVIIPLD